MSNNRRKLDYGEPFQRSVLKLMMKDHVFCTKAIELLRHNDFSPPLDWFFKRIVENFEILHKCPTKDDLTVDIGRQGDNQDQIPYMRELEAICNSEVDEGTVKKEMTGFVRLNMFSDVAYSAVEMIKRGKKDEAYSKLAEESRLLNTITFEKEKFVGFGDASNVLETMRAQKEGAIPTGIRAIDEALGGGMFPGTWTTFVGATNAGKSMVNISLAYFASLAGKKTFITIHEDEELPTKTRFLSCFSGIPYNRLIFGFYSLTEEEKKAIDDADVMLKEYVKIQFMYSQEATVEAVCDAARYVMKTWPYDLFICDYGGALTTKRFKDLSAARLMQEYIHYELKQLCLELNVPGAGGAQVNREAMNKNRAGSDLLRMTDVAEAIGIIKKSSTVITMNRSAKDIENHLIVYLLDKSRGGVTNLAVECVSDYPTCRTHLAFDPEKSNQRVLDQTKGLAERTSIEKKDDEDSDKESHG